MRLQSQGALQVHNIYMLLQRRAFQLRFLLLRGSYLCPQMQKCQCMGSAEMCCLLNSLLSFHQDRLCVLLLLLPPPEESSSSLNRGRLTSPRRFVTDHNPHRLAEWRGPRLSGRRSTRPLLQGDSAISREFIPDMIIAVKLQPATNNYDEC